MDTEIRRVYAAGIAVAVLVVAALVLTTFAPSQQSYTSNTMEYVQPAQYANAAAAAAADAESYRAPQDVAQANQPQPSTDTPQPTLMNETSPAASEPVARASEPIKSAGTELERPENMAMQNIPVQIPPLTVTAGVQPASSLALSGAGGVPFTNFTLTTGDREITVHSVTVEGAGLGNVSVFDSIDLTDDTGADLGETHFDANRRGVFTEEFTIPPHSTKVLTVLANMIADVSPYEGQMPQLKVVAIDASAPIVGALPIVGTAQSVNSTLTIGSAFAIRGEGDPGADGTHYINDTNIKFAGIRLTADSNEDLSFSSIRWRQNGSASPADIANLRAVVGGTSYPVEADDREYTVAFSPALSIRKGESVDIALLGDLTVSGSQRTVKMDIDSSADIALTGETYGYAVGVAAAGNTDVSGSSVFITSDGSTDGDEGTPFYSASTITISGGAVVTVQNATN